MLTKTQIQQQVQRHARKITKAQLPAIIRAHLTEGHRRKEIGPERQRGSLPSEQLSDVAKICVFAGGDTALRAQNAGADRVIESGELDRLASEKRTAKKLAREYQFFMADTNLMPKIGKILGQYLGPKGRMPTPIPPAAPIEAMLTRYRTAVRVKARGSLSVAGRLATSHLTIQRLPENALAVITKLRRNYPTARKTSTRCS